MLVEAANAGSALAAANLAHLAIEIGDGERADHWINIGREVDPQQERLLSAMELLRRKRDEEDSLERQRQMPGKKQLGEVRAIHPAEELVSLEGTWTNGAGLELDLKEQEGGRVYRGEFPKGPRLKLLRGGMSYKCSIESGVQSRHGIARLARESLVLWLDGTGSDVVEVLVLSRKSAADEDSSIMD
jgi:hypothetical protein